MHKYRYFQIASYGTYLHRSHLLRIDSNYPVYYSNENPRFFVKFFLYPICSKPGKLPYTQFSGHKKYFNKKITRINYENK